MPHIVVFSLLLLLSFFFGIVVVLILRIYVNIFRRSQFINAIDFIESIYTYFYYTNSIYVLVFLCFYFCDVKCGVLNIEMIWWKPRRKLTENRHPFGYNFTAYKCTCRTLKMNLLKIEATYRKRKKSTLLYWHQNIVVILIS